MEVDQVLVDMRRALAEVDQVVAKRRRDFAEVDRSVLVRSDCYFSMLEILDTFDQRYAGRLGGGLLAGAPVIRRMYANYVGFHLFLGFEPRGH